MAYKVFCKTCKTVEMGRNKIETDYLMAQHRKGCFDVEYVRVS